ncbi:MAG: hypothetical protein P0121_13875 [Nitrospira sp.]|nr:hypothetical protein [Nitrospira sp.]
MGSAKIDHVLEMDKRRLADLYFVYKLVQLVEWHKGVVGADSSQHFDA